jgi:hypothetical protein
VPLLSARLRELVNDPGMPATMGRASREIIAAHALSDALTGPIPASA